MVFNSNKRDNRQLIQTRTGEPYQPVRLYFEVYNPKTVLGVFNKLRCVQYSDDFEGWQWLYDQETKKLHFDISYNKIPKDFRPIILADIYLDGNEMIMDLRSFRRALHAIEFFFKRINSHAARLTRVRVVNRFFDAMVEDEDDLQPPFDHFFERDDVYVPNLEELDQKLTEVTEKYEDPDERGEALMEYLESQSKQTLPEFEELPVHIYEDKTTVGINMALMLRHVEAAQHWTGNTTFTQHDAIALLAGSMGDDDE